jgi:hypothetical protein
VFLSDGEPSDTNLTEFTEMINQKRRPKVSTIQYEVRCYGSLHEESTLCFSSLS